VFEAQLFTGPATLVRLKYFNTSCRLWRLGGLGRAVAVIWIGLPMRYDRAEADNAAILGSLYLKHPYHAYDGLSLTVEHFCIMSII